MHPAGLAAMAVTLLVLALTVPPLGRYIAVVFGAREDGSAPGDRVFLPVERGIYRAARIDPRAEQRWSTYTVSMLAFGFVSFLAVYAIQRLQGYLPFNPTGRGSVEPTVAFNTAASFLTNTNWQAYGGETTMSHLTQVLALTTQNVVSAAAGLAVAIAIIRAITRSGRDTVGNFWVDLVRGTLRVAFPLCAAVAVALVATGVIQNTSGFTTVTTLAGATQTIPGGPVASQVATKMFLTNGGGFFNVNGVHPFENPNGMSNLIQVVGLVLLPLALVVAFGRLTGSRKQATVLLSVMAALFLTFSLLTMGLEQAGNPQLTPRGVDQAAGAYQAGGNMEGKDTRFGPATCGLWAGFTTGTSDGGVNCMHDSMTPLGGMVPTLHMMLGEVSPGGLGVGLMGLLINALLAVFIAGLMVGRTPEFLGKKIQAGEMKLVVLYIVTMPATVLVLTAISVLLPSAVASMTTRDAHGLSQVLYSYVSTANNNGSAFGGLSASTPWFTITHGVAMLIGRWGLIIPAMAVGGSLVRKRKVPVTAGTFPTDTPLFGGLVLAVVLLVAGLTFFPALALGPILEFFSH